MCLKHALNKKKLLHNFPLEKIIVPKYECGSNRLTNKIHI